MCVVLVGQSIVRIAAGLAVKRSIFRWLVTGLTLAVVRAERDLAGPSVIDHV